MSPASQNKSGPTPEENRLLMLEMEERFVGAINDLKESEERSSEKLRWAFGIISGVMIFAMGSIGIPLLVMVYNLGMSVTTLEAEIKITDKLESRINALSDKVNEIDKNAVRREPH